MTDYELENGVWKQSVVEVDKDGNESEKWLPCLITDIPVTVLLEQRRERLQRRGRTQ